MPDSVKPPHAPRHPERRTHHGDVVVDEYAWMRDKESPELLSLLAAENAYTTAQTEHLAGLRERIYAEIKGRTKETDLTVPEFTRHRDRAFWYYSRTIAGKNYPVICRLPATDREVIPDLADQHPDEVVLLDCNILAAGEAYFSLGACDVSPDGSLLAFSLDLSGDERYRIRFKDLATGELLPDEVAEAHAGGCWSTDASFCYLAVDDAWRPHQVWRHTLGAVGPELLLQEDDERFWLGIEESRDRAWVVISAGSKNTSECWLLPADDRAASPLSVAGRREGVEYQVELAGDRMYIVHNDGAPDFALSDAPLPHGPWRTLWPGVPGTRLLDVSAYDRALVACFRRDGVPGVRVYPRDAGGELGESWEIDFDEPLFEVDADGGEDPDTDRIRLGYQSLVTPRSVLEYHLDDRSLRVLKRTPVLDPPGRPPYQASDYVQRRLWATAPDGVRVPVSVVHRADLPLDGSAPCLLYGYGAYEVTVPITFSIPRISLLDRGFVFAIAHVRGGGELGRRWYESGRLLAKRNTFDDFVACAGALCEAGYTNPRRLGTEGGSAGGMLIGAVLNQAPEAFGAALAAVPFVDCLTTILNPALPLTVVEWEEWGDPLHDPGAYDYIKGYAPYDNIDARDYPAVLVTTSLNDTRVEVTEPAKWVSRMRALAPDAGAPQVLLKTEMVAGHGGVSGRYDAWRDRAFELAWLIDRLAPELA